MVIAENNYQLWNRIIFEKFFNSQNADEKVLFAVNKEIIEKLGYENNISNPYDNFCQSVFNEIIEKSSKGKYSIKLQKLGNATNGNLPAQAALIAFFILAAANMGKEHRNDEDRFISSRNYFIRLSELLFNKIAPKNMLANQYSQFEKLFKDFEETVNKKMNGEKGTIKFTPLYREGKSGRKDYVGIPIFQSILSENDRALLTKVFYECNQKEQIQQYDIDIQKNYSRIFKLMYGKHIDKLLRRINELFGDWNYKVIEIDEKTGEKKVVAKCENYYFEIDGGRRSLEFQFYKFNGRSKNIDKIEDRLIKIGIDDIKMQNDHILFRKEDKYYGYLQIGQLHVGDVFSIIATPSFFNSNQKSICNATGLTDEEFVPKGLKDDSSLMILPKLMAVKICALLNIKEQADKIFFKKGLKLDKNIYLKGAEPILHIEMPLGYGSVLINIDGQNATYSKPVDLREDFNLTEHHKVKIQSSFRDYYSYEIKDFEHPDSGFKFLYNLFDNSNITKDFEYNEDTPYLSGVIIENYKNLSALNSQKIEYIMAILQKQNSKDSFINCDKIIANILNKMYGNVPESILAKFRILYCDRALVNMIKLKYLQELERLVG